MTILRIKPKVSLLGLQPQITLAIVVAHSCYSNLQYDGECVITSCTEGKHSKGSRHYVGLAFDVRTRDLPTKKRSILAGMIGKCLTNQYDVVLEKTHIHVEYDPER